MFTDNTLLDSIDRKGILQAYMESSTCVRNKSQTFYLTTSSICQVKVIFDTETSTN